MNTASATRSNAALVRSLAATAICVIWANAASAAKPPDWRTVEADNGQKYVFDANKIHRSYDGSVILDVFPAEEGQINEHDFQEYYLDCHHHYYDEDPTHSQQAMYAAPRSVMREIEETACVSASDVTQTPPQVDVEKSLDGISPRAQVPLLENGWLTANQSCVGLRNEASECALRDRFTSALTARGMCYGRPGELDYQMNWHACGQ